MRVESKALCGEEFFYCYENLNPDADVFPDIIIKKWNRVTLYNIKFNDQNEDMNIDVNSKETALKIAELYIDDMSEGEDNE